MKVTATQKGYYGGAIREPGEEFDIEEEEHFSENWMTTDEDFTPPSDDDDDDNRGSYKAVHKGRGKWDVLDPDGDVVEDGDNLKKDAAEAMVEELNAELDEE